MSRLLGAVRLSHLTDETLSPATQREKITFTAKARGDELVYVAEDLDVSGSVSAWNRDLAPWLEDPDKIKLWDTLIVAKLDRLTRSLLDFQKLLEWCAANNKTIISVSEGFDLSTPVGKLIANILVMFAEFERERMGERRSERAQADKARGWWGGGRTKFGFTAVKVDSHYEVIEDPDEKAVAYRLAAEILKGKSAAQIARELTAEGVPTKVGGKWASTTILDIVRDPAGILDTDTWAKLQPVIGALSKPQTNRYDAARLAGVVFCGRCEHPLWAHHTKRGDAQWDYYRCYNCKAKMIRQVALEEATDDLVISLYGDNPHTEQRLIVGSDNQRILKDIDRQLTELTSKLTAKTISRADYRSKQDLLLTEQERLESLPSEPDRYEPVDTGMTVTQYWASIDWPEKRRYFTDRGWVIYATAGEHRGDIPIVRIEGGEMEADAVALGAPSFKDIERQAQDAQR